MMPNPNRGSIRHRLTSGTADQMSSALLELRAQYPDVHEYLTVARDLYGIGPDYATRLLERRSADVETIRCAVSDLHRSDFHRWESGGWRCLECERQAPMIDTDDPRILEAQARVAAEREKLEAMDAAAEALARRIELARGRAVLHPGPEAHAALAALMAEHAAARGERAIQAGVVALVEADARGTASAVNAEAWHAAADAVTAARISAAMEKERTR
jgi:hypothetical protein